MNARLQVKVLNGRRSEVSHERPAAVLRLIGEGLDAIVQHTREPAANWLIDVFFPGGHDRADLPYVPTEAQRIARYEIASALFSSPEERRSHEHRQAVGEQLQRAWRQHQYPNLRRARGLIPLPVRPRAQAVAR